MKKNIIITIDGPAASGKGTLARRLAEHLGYYYLDTGAIYRLVGLEASKRGLTPETQEAELAALAKEIAGRFTPESLSDPALKSDTAGQMASRSAALPAVRAAVLDLQRNLAANPPGGEPGAVLDGRDCGTVIRPDASHKFFITAQVEERAKRRFAELTNNHIETRYEDVLNDMKARDERDSQRTTAPMKPAPDAVIINTTDMDGDDVFQTVLGHISPVRPAPR